MKCIQQNKVAYCSDEDHFKIQCIPARAPQFQTLILRTFQHLSVLNLRNLCQFVEPNTEVVALEFLLPFQRTDKRTLKTS